MSAGRLGGLLLAQGKPAAALPVVQKEVAGLERVVAKDPNNRNYIRFLATAYELAGDVHEAAGQFLAAKTSYIKVISLSEQLLRTDPGQLPASKQEVEGHLKLGLVLSQEGDSKALEPIGIE